MKKNYWTTVCFIFLSTIFIQAQDIVFPKGAAIHYEIEKNASQVVHTALSIFEGDLNRVLNASLNKSNKKGSGKLIIHTLNSKDHNDNIASKHEAFRVEVKDGNLYVTGADANGTAYGIMELSRMLGVSPWEWWADSAPSLKDKWIIPSGFFSEQSPAVLYRGIFLNDEDWGLLPWSYKNYEPSDIKGRIGPKTYKAIFELMLRLRANILWPAMHEVTIPFYFVEGNREMADRYGITIGTSHCEPLQRSTPVEWPAAGVGDYDYVNNSDNVYKFWEERVKEVSGSNNYFTIGMRGVHDGKMQGAQTIEEQRAVLERVFKDQRALIAKYIDSDVASVPQVFIPYKEVLDIYRSGLEVPDDVTLMWCDDNYGYMRSLPNKQEQLRSGGNGLYYHISYWGRPHDYLWLASTSPSLIRTELERAYEHNVRQIWIFNVGDIKPGEYLLEYCLDLAWDQELLYNRDSNIHLKQWLTREFGEDIAEKLVPLWNEYYSLNYQRRPEFLGNTRTEERSEPLFNIVKDLPWYDREVVERLERCEELEKDIRELSLQIDESDHAQWYQLVEYPILAMSAMNRKMLNGQLARHGKVSWSKSTEAFDEIVRMTDRYNNILDGKWKYMMDYKPRNLSVFAPLDTTQISLPIPEPSGRNWKLKPSDGNFSPSSYTVSELGYSREALVLKEGDTFTATLPKTSGALTVTLAFVPNHPAGIEQLEVKVGIDGERPRYISYETYDRSEEWKNNVLRNQALRTITLPPSSNERKIIIQALTPSIILDELIVESK